MIKEIKENVFDEVINAKCAIVDFNAIWCSPCRMLAPVIEELSDEIDMPFFSVDVDKNDKIADKYGISSIPTIMLFKNGKVVNKEVGYIDKDELKEFILINLE